MATTSETPQSLTMTPELYAYLLAHGTRPDELLDELARLTQERFPSEAHMQIPPEEGWLLTFLARLIGATTIVEVGTFTGYSSICLARGLSPDGRLLTCDVSTASTALARDFWQRAGVADRIDLRIAPALETLRELPEREHVDMAFIDADKPGYISYWDELLPRMRAGGLVVVDNVLFHGEVIDAMPAEKPAAIHAFNVHAAVDRRVELVMLVGSDGLTLARKLPAA